MSSFDESGFLPPCTEKLTSVILEKPSLVGSNQLDKLRNSIEDEEGRILKFNFRKIQPLNRRKTGSAILTVIDQCDKLFR